MVSAILLLTGMGGAIQASGAASFPCCGGKVVTPVVEPTAGRFLVARRDIFDPLFGRAVVFVLRHGPLGTAGLIINRSSGLDLSDVVSGLDSPDQGSRPVFIGGPVELTVASMLFRDAPEGDHVEHIADSVYFSKDRGVLTRLLKERKPDDALHIYFGYVGWLPGQLQREITSGAWFVIDTDPAIIFNAKPGSIWHQLIERLDPDGILARNLRPVDPSSGLGADEGPAGMPANGVGPRRR